MPQAVTYVVRYQVTSSDHRVPSREFDDADEAVSYAAGLLADGNVGVHVMAYGSRKAALEREEASPRTGTAA